MPIFQIDTITGAPYTGHTDGAVLIPSAALTATTISNDQINTNYRGVVVYIAPGTFGSGASTITVKIQAKDVVGNFYFDLLTSASLVASTPVLLTLYPGVTPATNLAASTVLPRTWRVSAQASNGGSGGSTLGFSCCILI